MQCERSNLFSQHPGERPGGGHPGDALRQGRFRPPLPQPLPPRLRRRQAAQVLLRVPGARHRGGDAGWARAGIQYLRCLSASNYPTRPCSPPHRGNEILVHFLKLQKLFWPYTVSRGSFKKSRFRDTFSETCK